MNRTRRALLGFGVMWGSLLVIDWFVHRHMGHQLMVVGTVQALCFAFYLMGAALVLASVGSAIEWRLLGTFDLREFAPTRHPCYVVGLWLNRLASVAPPMYLLLIGWRRLPWYVSVWNVCDIGIALGVALLVTPLVRTLHRDAKKP